MAGRFIAALIVGTLLSVGAGGCAGLLIGYKKTTPQMAFLLGVFFSVLVGVGVLFGLIILTAAGLV